MNEEDIHYVDNIFVINLHLKTTSKDNYEGNKCSWVVSKSHYRVLRHTVTLFIQGGILVQNLFTIYIIKEINACFTHQFL